MSENKIQPVRFQRANFLVRDIDKSLTLYRDVFGFEVDYLIPASDDSYGDIVFGGTPLTRMVALNLAGQTRCLALSEMPNAPLADGVPPNRSTIVLEAQDFDAHIASAMRLGLHVYPEHALTPPDGRIGREQALLDWDGNMSVLYAFP